MSDSEKHGPQFSADRFTGANDMDTIARAILRDTFDADNVTGTEPDTPYDNFAEEKALHQLLDYAGVDYTVDTRDRIFGVNHRVNDPAKRRRFDLRSDTGDKSKPAETDLLKATHGTRDFGPAYALRVKRGRQQPVEWARLVHLQPLAGAMTVGPFHEGEWEDEDKGVKSWFYSYDLLRNMGCVVAEYDWSDIQSLLDTPEGEYGAE